MKNFKINKLQNIALTMLMIVSLFMSAKVQSQTFINFTATDGLADDFATGIAIDTNNVKWVATANGVGRYNDTAWTTYRIADGLVDNYIYSIAVDKNNQVWAGTANGVCKFNGTTWTTYTTTDGLIDNNINYIYGAGDGSVWFASQAGVSRYNAGTFTNFTTTQGLPTNTISYISADNTGNIWFCTQMGGVSKYNGTTFANYSKSTTDSLLDDNTFAIAFDNNNNRLIGTFYGISKINSSDIWTNNYRMADGLYNDFVRDIKRDHDGNFWIGVFADYNFDGGISHFDGTSWYSYSVPQGLVNTQVTAIAIDKQNKPWVSTGGGISKFNGNVGIETNISAASVEVYPNPAKDVISIIVKDQQYDMNIVDLQGKTVMSSVLSSSDNQINVSILGAGVYFIHLSNSKNSITKKLIING